LQLFLSNLYKSSAIFNYGAWTQKDRGPKRLNEST